MTMTDNFATARQSMVLCQLRPNNVTNDRIVEAMNAAPREKFVPKHLNGVAYLDEDLEIAPGRYLVEPRVFAKLIQEADPNEDDVVLDIGCATGYSACVLGALTRAVVAIESSEELVEKANRIISELECENVAVMQGDLADGNAKQGPYDIIHINGAISSVPQSLLDQLSDTGRLICVEGAGPGVATIYEKQDGHISRRSAFEASLPLLPDFSSQKGFLF